MHLDPQNHEPPMKEEDQQDQNNKKKKYQIEKIRGREGNPHRSLYETLDLDIR